MLKPNLTFHCNEMYVAKSLRVIFGDGGDGGGGGGGHSNG